MVLRDSAALANECSKYAQENCIVGRAYASGLRVYSDCISNLDFRQLSCRIYTAVVFGSRGDTLLALAGRVDQKFAWKVTRKGQTPPVDQLEID